MASADETRRALARHASRLSPDWQPGCFVGAIARVIEGGSADETDVASGGTPAHFVGAAWPPADAVPDRWPDAVVIASPTAQHALLELLLQLPAEARLHLVPAQAVDFGLAVRIVRIADRNLQAWQRDALDAFLDAWHQADHEAILARFTDRDAGFERFVDRVIGGQPPSD